VLAALDSASPCKILKKDAGLKDCRLFSCRLLPLSRYIYCTLACSDQVILRGTISSNCLDQRLCCAVPGFSRYKSNLSTHSSSSLLHHTAGDLLQNAKARELMGGVFRKSTRHFAMWSLLRLPPQNSENPLRKSLSESVWPLLPSNFKISWIASPAKRKSAKDMNAGPKTLKLLVHV